MNHPNHPSERNEACPICEPAKFDVDLAETPFPCACPIHRLHPGALAFQLRPVYEHEPGALINRLAIQGGLK